MKTYVILFMLICLFVGWLLGVYCNQAAITADFVLVPKRQLVTHVDSLLYERAMQRAVAIACADPQPPVRP